MALVASLSTAYADGSLVRWAVGEATIDVGTDTINHQLQPDGQRELECQVGGERRVEEVDEGAAGAVSAGGVNRP